jgi:Leucine-rich repeat (LRR) protein
MKKYLQYIKESKEVIRLNYSDQELTELPELPNSLQSLWCDDNKLTSLPKLPNSLQKLNCSFNQLIELPKLPDSLQVLYCFRNKLTSLPKLPNKLKELKCFNNELKELPELPDSLEKLNCIYNPLICLIPSKFIEQQRNDWLGIYYYPMINSYKGQKSILEQDESNVTELLKQTNGNIHQKIKDEYKHLFKAAGWGLI